MAGCYAHAIVQVSGKLLKEWHFVVVSDTYEQVYLFHAWLGFLYVQEFPLVQKPSFSQKRLQLILEQD